MSPPPNPYAPPKADVLEPAPGANLSRPVALAANTLFRRVPDGRVVFQPWGKYGACYLPDDSQRLRRARIQAGFGSLVLATSVVAIQFLSTLQVVGIVLPLELALQFLLIALFARGLPRTAPPAAPSRDERRSLARARLAERARLMGKARLWTMLVVSLLFVLGGVAMAVTGGSPATAAGAILFFGACAVVFVLQLRSL